MNFKRFHESKNLFPLDESKLHVGRIENDGTIDYEVGTLTVGTDSITYEANTAWRGFYTDFIQVNENENLTFSPLNSSIMAWFCNCYDENGGFLGKASGQSAGSIRIFTLLAGTKKVRISVTSSNTTYTILRPMLNAGNTALPYEPYSSEVWHDIPHYIHNTSTDTITTLPTVIYPTGTTATIGLKGNTSQSGTPTPDNPIIPQGTGERTGNLAYGRIDTVNIFSNGVIVRAGGYDVAIGRVELGIVYTVNSYVLAFYTNEPTPGSVSYDGSRIVATAGRPTIFTAPITGYVAFRLSSGEQAMLNTGSTALPYELFGYKIPISSASTTTPVYLGEVKTVRRIRKLVLTGEESFSNQYGTNLFSVLIQPFGKMLSFNSYCTHYKYNPAQSGLNANTQNGDFALQLQSTQTLLAFKDTTYSSVADFKSYLAAQYANGTPVTVWYVLATEETAVVNEPLMRIGDYADTVSNVSIPVTAGGDTLSVDTTVQPSEVTVNYKGWHPVADVHERENGQWD